MDFKTDEIKIRTAAINALRLAEELKVESLAFPALGCGVGGFPLMAAAKSIAQEVFRHLRERESKLKEIIFCLFDPEALAIFEQGVVKYLEHLTEKISSGPFITVDIIIEIDAGIVVVKRSNPPFGWALPGGFVDYGESLEAAAAREAKEETGLTLSSLEQFHTYSQPGRDPRFHTVSTVFLAKAEGIPQAGDDAAGLKIIKPPEIETLGFAFDHQAVLRDYLQFRRK
jgi:ADP-ribose pyrophosphatase YjhB (NUDIX family)